MCGIYAYLGSGQDLESIKQLANKTSCRGPDVTTYEKISDNVFFGFHRLCICDRSENGNQPMKHPRDSNITLICNGEIYNYEFLVHNFNIKTRSKSDCEIVLHLYKLFGIGTMMELIDGDFAFVLHDKNTKTTYAGRDRFGVRPLFYGTDEEKGVYFSSEIKALPNTCIDVQHVKPGHLWCSNAADKFINLLSKKYPLVESSNTSIDEISAEIYQYLSTSVKKRLMGDREIGCLLSGGLDSSLVTALACKHSNMKIKTFSIGMKGSTDLKYAQIAAKHLGTEHHEVIFAPEEGLEAIPDVIYALESYDITTVRASVGMFLVSKYIKNNTDVKVILSGEGSDEIAQGYIYFHKAPSAKDAHEESCRLITDLYMYDVLRSDRTTAAHGLEIRVPFLDSEFVRRYMAIKSNLKQPLERCEKYTLRRAFDRDNLLPNEILWRPKEAFSDGVSGLRLSWFQIIQNHCETIVSDEQLANAYKVYSHNTPHTKEAYWYRTIFESYFSGRSNLIPYFWMPKWSNTSDPSARSLSHYVQA